MVEKKKVKTPRLESEINYFFIRDVQDEIFLFQKWLKGARPVCLEDCQPLRMFPSFTEVVHAVSS